MKLPEISVGHGRRQARRRCAERRRPRGRRRQLVPAPPPRPRRARGPAHRDPRTSPRCSPTRARGREPRDRSTSCRHDAPRAHRRGRSPNERLARALAAPVGRFAGHRDVALGALDDPDGLRRAARAIGPTSSADFPSCSSGSPTTSLAPGGHVCWAADARRRQRLHRRSPRRDGARTVVKSQVDGDRGDRPQRGARSRRLPTSSRPTSASGSSSWPTRRRATSSPRPCTCDRHQVADTCRPRLTDGRSARREPEHLAAFAREQLRRRVPGRRHGHLGRATSAWPRPARSCSSRTRATAGWCTTVPARPRRRHGHGARRRRLGAARPDVNLLARRRTGQHLSLVHEHHHRPAARRRGRRPRRAPRRDPRQRPQRDPRHRVPRDPGCIRCGACLNVCPVYRQIGGHAYGWVYSGPVGAVLTPLLAGRAPRGGRAGQRVDAVRRLHGRLPGRASRCRTCCSRCGGASAPARDVAPSAPRGRRGRRRGRSPPDYRASVKAMRTGRGLARFAALAPGLARWAAGRAAPSPPRARSTSAGATGLCDGPVRNR